MIKTLPYLFSIFLFFATCLQSQGQSLRYPVALPYLSLGAYTTQQQDPFSFTNNQAALAQVKSAGLGVYGERRFMLAENSVYGMALAIPTKLGNFGLSLNYAGFSNFNENKAGIAYARSLGSKLDIGVQFNYYGYRIPQYGNASTVNFEAGAILHVLENLHAGIHIYNPVATELDKGSEEKLASAYKFGLGYDVTEQFSVSAEIRKEEYRALNVTGGIQYQFMKQFFARAGFMSDTGSMFAGAGVQWKNLRLDLSGGYHPQLGFSPGMLLIVNFNEPGK